MWSTPFCVRMTGCRKRFAPRCRCAGYGCSPTLASELDRLLAGGAAVARSRLPGMGGQNRLGAAWCMGLLHRQVTSEMACRVGRLEGCCCAQALPP